ncbi:hypothetical protein B0H65DRAFT_445112 [Neurospora tetraspora]|uniref:Transmembrane protein n=1 Tax=Neurospora tetraspora TaxID=94610 RepID=A0AAE0J853_9PEZI|nr:hypothetical protein B0H65DRAFT_445112 [Neurospora tetraspora]
MSQALFVLLLFLLSHGCFSSCLQARRRQKASVSSIGTGATGEPSLAAKLNYREYLSMVMGRLEQAGRTVLGGERESDECAALGSGNWSQGVHVWFLSSAVVASLAAIVLVLGEGEGDGDAFPSSQPLAEGSLETLTEGAGAGNNRAPSSESPTPPQGEVFGSLFQQSAVGVVV